MGKLNARKVAALAKDEPRKTADDNSLRMEKNQTNCIPFVLMSLATNKLHCD